MTDEVEILKTDALGRVTLPKEKREALLEEFARSGLSGQKFAKHYGIKYSTFASWIRKRRHARGEYPEGIKREAKLGAHKPSRPLALIEAVVEKEESQGVVVELPGGGRIEVKRSDDVGIAVELIRALRDAQL